MYGWNFLGYHVGLTLIRAFGSIGMRNFTHLRGSASFRYGLIHTNLCARYRCVPMHYVPIVGDIWSWEQYEPPIG